MILLSDEEIGIVLRRCDCSLVDTRHNIEEPDEHKEVAKAQLKKVVEWLGENYRGYPDGISDRDWQALLKEVEDDT